MRKKIQSQFFGPLKKRLSTPDVVEEEKGEKRKEEEPRLEENVQEVDNNNPNSPNELRDKKKAKSRKSAENSHRKLTRSLSSNPKRHETTKIADKQSIGPYIFMESIGRGGYGIVWKGLNTLNGSFVAIKKVSINKGLQEENLSSLMMEIQLLQRLKHANIVKYIDHVLSRKSICIVMEYMEIGSLREMVKNHGVFPEFLVIVYMRQILDGLTYLHEQGVIHRDIKSANILLSTDGSVKLADFGVATQLRDLGASFGGTPYWMAPEVIKLQGATTACDIWSVGCTIIELLTGFPPYYELDTVAALYCIVNEDHPPLPEGISPSLRDFLMRCFQKDENLRISSEKLQSHPWIKANPSKRYLDMKKIRRQITKYNKELEGVGITNEKPPYPISVMNSRDLSDSSPNSKTNSKNRMGLNNVNNLWENASQSPKSEKSIRRNLNEDYFQDEEGTNPDANGQSEVELEQELEGTKEKQQEIESKRTKLTASYMSEDTEDLVSPEDDLQDSRGDTVIIKYDLLPNDDNNNNNIQDIKEITVAAPSDVDSEAPLNGKEDEKFWSKESNKTTFLPKPTVQGMNGKHLSTFKEKDCNEDDFMEGFEDTKLPTKLELKVRTDWDEEIEETFDSEEEKGWSDNMIKDKFKEQLLKDALALLQKLSDTTDPDIISKTCSQLTDIFKHELEGKIHVITQHGILPILSQLSSQKDPTALQFILKMINQFVRSSTEILEAFCLLGGIPTITAFAKNGYSVQIRLEVARIVEAMCSASTSTLHMFIGCSAFPILSNLLEMKYDEYKEIIHCCLNSIIRVFRLQTRTPKSGFCYLFAKEGVVAKLSVGLGNITARDLDSEMQRYFNKLADTLLLFSQADSPLVKEELCKPEVLESIRNVIAKVKPVDTGDEISQKIRDALLKLLKFVKNISMDPHRRDALANAGFIPVLVELLTLNGGMDRIHEIHNQALNSIWYLCQLNRDRQAAVASAGIIPPLLHILEEKVALKEMAVAILFQLLHASESTRQLLWQANSMDMYLQLLSDENYYSDSVDCLASWLKYDPINVEKELQKTENIQRLRNIFQFAKKKDFSKVLQSFLDIISKSNAINNAMGDSTVGTIPLLLDNLHDTKDPFSKVQLLKILNSLFLNSERKLEMVTAYRLYPNIKNIVDKESSVIVQQMAEQLLQNFNTLQERKKTI